MPSRHRAPAGSVAAIVVLLDINLKAMKHWSDAYADGLYVGSAIVSALMFVGAIVIFLH